MAGLNVGTGGAVGGSMVRDPVVVVVVVVVRADPAAHVGNTVGIGSTVGSGMLQVRAATVGSAALAVCAMVGIGKRDGSGKLIVRSRVGIGKLSVRSRVGIGGSGRLMMVRGGVVRGGVDVDDVVDVGLVVGMRVLVSILVGVGESMAGISGPCAAATPASSATTKAGAERCIPDVHAQELG